MMTGTGKPLFIRRGLQIVPASRLGWIAMLSFVLLVAGGSIALFASFAAPSDALVLIWAALVAAATLLFTIWSWRVAEVIDPPPHRDENYWFVPRLFGLGATPVTWQGWALVLGTVALVAFDMRFAEPGLVKVVIAIALLVTLIGVSAHKTAGGWRWRWGTRE